MSKKVKMKIHIGGQRDGANWPPIGGVIEVSDHEADVLVALDHAEHVEEEKRETASVAPAEKAARTGATGSRRKTTSRRSAK